MKAYRGINLSANAWGSDSTYDASYETHLTYDANGNIKLKCNSIASSDVDMDSETLEIKLSDLLKETGN